MMPPRPNINDRYPIRESLSPPVVAAPIPECSQAVFVSGFIPHATVRVFANGAELLAEESPPFAFKEITLSRRVKLGESITATQQVGTIQSPHSIQPVIVSPLQQGAVQNTKPDVGKQLFQCGIVVPVGNLIPGTRVHVSENGAQIGNDPVAQTWHPVVTQPLHAGGHVVAQAIACEGTSHEVNGPVSDDVIVQAAPVPTPSPHPDGDSMIPGNDCVVLTGLLCGAGLEIFDGGTSISKGWYATGDANTVPLSQPLQPGSSITATQELCGNVSVPSEVVHPSGRLRAPTVLAPICPESQFVILRDTVINAIVVIFRNGQIVGYGGAGPGDVVVGLGGNQRLHAGDTMTAIQYMGSTISPVSNSVTVSRRLEQPVVEILGGEPFFLPRAHEQPIEGPVFPRGRGSGPAIRVQACCNEKVSVRILDPNGKVIAEPPLTTLIPGYYVGSWPWTSLTGWSVPDGIPVGRYTLTARSACSPGEARVPFYVIFDPADVGGPPRFSFDDTAVWFGTSKNDIRGLHYYLRQSDKRVFDKAITAVNGMTDSYQAAVAVARAEESLFAYSLNYHTQDVLDLILNYSEAQCADDAACLTSLLRAVGIPAHPVTADAALETGAANWTFDTWVEFLAPFAGSTEWRVFHPHEYPGMMPESRSQFGSTRHVATKGFNDLIVMANESWTAAALDDNSPDGSYGRNGCGEPNQNVTKAYWIDELCEAGYWASPHWDCTGINTMSLHTHGARFGEAGPAFGGRLSGMLEVSNRSREREFGTLHVEIVSSRYTSKRFPDESFGGSSLRIALDPDKPLAMPFDIDLPRTLAPDHELFLWAHLDGHTLALQKLTVRPAIACTIGGPRGEHPTHTPKNASVREYSIDDEITIRATIRNVSDRVVSGIDVRLEAPFVLDAMSCERRWERLEPGESREIPWTLRAIAPLQSGKVRVSVATVDGGSVVSSYAFKVNAHKSTIQPSPAWLPEKRRKAQ